MHLLDALGRGGAEVLALDVCRNARANNLDLTFVATGGGDLEEDFRSSGVEFVRLNRRLPIDLNLVAQLRRIIKERDITIVHSHQAVEAIHAYLATARTKTKQVMSFHLCGADAKNRIALKFLTPRMDANIAVSRDLLDCLSMQAGLDTSSTFQVVYNGVDAERLKVTGISLRDELGIAGSDLLLGMVGNFYGDARKDQFTVCRALPQLFEHEPSARFVFVGAISPAAPQVYDECVEFCRREKIFDRVHFLGKRADVPDILSSLDIFVLSSFQEGLPIAAIEALMKGIPTVVSDIGPLLEVTGRGEYAMVFRTGDADDLARRLIELAGDPVRRVNLGAKGREWAMRQFSIEAHIANLLKVYESLSKTS
jgi:glycosyltransferase involved in cell wall biosynthesis